MRKCQSLEMSGHALICPMLISVRYQPCEHLWKYLHTCHFKTAGQDLKFKKQRPYYHEQFLCVPAERKNFSPFADANLKTNKQQNTKNLDIQSKRKTKLNGPNLKKKKKAIALNRSLWDKREGDLSAHVYLVATRKLAPLPQMFFSS